jgi:hypothetical protein
MQDPDKYGVSKFLGEAKLKGTYLLVIAPKRKVPAILDKEGEGKVGAYSQFLKWEFPLSVLIVQEMAESLQCKAARGSNMESKADYVTSM